MRSLSQLGSAARVAVLALAVLGVGGAGVASGEPFAVKATMTLTGPPVEIVNPSNHDFSFENPVETFTQAGGHPYALTTRIEFPTEVHGTNQSGQPELAPVGDPKDIVTDLPRGLLGNPQAAPRCPPAQLVGGVGCPSATQVGFFVLHRTSQEEFAPIYNLVPEKGQSAEFGLRIPFGITYLLTAHVIRKDGSYAVAVASHGLPITALYGVELTFWGVPADPSHDRQRGLRCGKLNELQTCEENGGESSGAPEVPFLTAPADCGLGADGGLVLADSWEQPGVYREAPVSLPGVNGCDLLQFSPSIAVAPDTSVADEPVGLGVTVNVPQAEGAAEAATPQVRNSVVTLPEGLSISPGVVDGVQACDETGPSGINFEGPESEEVGLDGEKQLAPGRCPDAAIIGTARAFTPLLGEPIEGHVYLAKPLCGGPGQHMCTVQDALDGDLYQLYLELGGVGPLADAGVNLKVRGKTEANPATGQLTTVFENTPELPFYKLEIHLNGGPRAPLDNPVVCGPAVTTSRFTPWSGPALTPEGIAMPGTGDATPSSYYLVGGCQGSPGLAPGFVAGTVSSQAGQFSPFTLNLSRADREQFIKGIQVKTPPGLLGMLSSVQLCGAGEAETGSCPDASKIGTATVASGAGSHPFEITGSVYLTGPYDGAPFGLSVVTPAVAGPFNLGLVVVRARIQVDPTTSALTITTDETGPHAVPQILDGVPLRLKRITVNIDRPGFMFNPTNCSGQQITATVSGAQDALAGVSSPFAAGGCKSLAFKPSFAVATTSRTSKANGSDLDVKLSYPPDALGNDANIKSVKVELPKQLPSRLTTLQRACTAEVFASDPAACPAASVVGIAKASTPVLPVGLSGPVYFVSNGGAAFPDLIVVLQGDGVRVDLTGNTFISKAGITSSTFKTIPDVPVSTFELYLPQGPYSALTANSNLCDQTKTTTRRSTRRIKGRTVRITTTVRRTQPVSLVMPTEFTAQNGAVLRQDTKITVTGCSAVAKANTKVVKRHGRKK